MYAYNMLVSDGRHSNLHMFQKKKKKKKIITDENSHPTDLDGRGPNPLADRFGDLDLLLSLPREVDHYIAPDGRIVRAGLPHSPEYLATLTPVYTADLASGGSRSGLQLLPELDVGSVFDMDYFRAFDFNKVNSLLPQLRLDFGSGMSREALETLDTSFLGMQDLAELPETLAGDAPEGLPESVAERDGDMPSLLVGPTRARAALLDAAERRRQEPGRDDNGVTTAAEMASRDVREQQERDNEIKLADMSSQEPAPQPAAVQRVLNAVRDANLQQREEMLSPARVLYAVVMGLMNGVFIGLGDPISAALGEEQCRPSVASVTALMDRFFSLLKSFGGNLIRLRFRECASDFKELIALVLEFFDVVINMVKTCDHLRRTILTMLVVIAVAVIVTGALVATGLGFFIKVISILLTIVFGMHFLLRLIGNFARALTCFARPGGCDGNDLIAIITHTSEFVGFLVGVIVLSGFHKVLRAEGMAKLLKASSYREYAKLFTVRAQVEVRTFLPRMEAAKARFFARGAKAVEAMSGSSAASRAFAAAKQSVESTSREVASLHEKISSIEKIARRTRTGSSSNTAAKSQLEAAQAELLVARTRYSDSVSQLADLVSKAGSSSSGYKALAIQVSEKVSSAGKMYIEAMRAMSLASRSRSFAVARAKSAVRSAVRRPNSARARYDTAAEEMAAFSRATDDLTAAITTSSSRADDVLAWSKSSPDKLTHLWSRQLLAKSANAHLKAEVIRLRRMVGDLDEMARSLRQARGGSGSQVSNINTNQGSVAGGDGMLLQTVEQAHRTATARLAAMETQAAAVSAEAVAVRRLYATLAKARVDKAMELGKTMRSIRGARDKASMIDDASLTAKMLAAAEGVSHSALRITKKSVLNGLSIVYSGTMQARKAVAVYLFGANLDTQNLDKHLNDGRLYRYVVSIRFDRVSELEAQSSWNLLASDDTVGLIGYNGLYGVTPVRDQEGTNLELSTGFAVYTDELRSGEFFLFREASWVQGGRACVGMADFDLSQVTPGVRDENMLMPLSPCDEDEILTAGDAIDSPEASQMYTGLVHARVSISVLDTDQGRIGPR
jgi:hypothetical protein